MKCPYRKITLHRLDIDGKCSHTVDEEAFADCYEWECPFYFAIADTCRAAETMANNANKGEKKKKK